MKDEIKLPDQQECREKFSRTFRNLSQEELNLLFSDEFVQFYKKGSIVYEIQQATDMTYRFYDYHRKDEQGQERELHLEQAIDCLSYDPKMMKNDIHPVITTYENYQQTVFISNSL